jgi:alkylation response protein AidB-like acyl-CoA dehydrogenase
MPDSPDQAMSLADQLRALQRGGQLRLPAPGHGATAGRLQALLEFGRTDLSLARVVEAHTDAVAILTEAGCRELRESLYGVWASDGPGSRLEVTRGHDGRLQLNGRKRFCSGATLVDAALVTAHEGDKVLLVQVPLSLPGLSVAPDEWATAAFAATRTSTVIFNTVQLDEAAIVGSPGWYLARPGFWHGALGPAACWAGGAIGLIEAARRLNRGDPHSRAHLGALQAAEWGLRALLSRAGDEIDADPADELHQAQRRALMVRHLIERACTEVLDRFGRATGPQLLAFDAQAAQRYAELTLYIRQCHAERDLASIPL